MADLIVETGAVIPGANSYCTEDEADLYFEMRLHTSVWDAASSEDKEKALMWATRLLDEQVLWYGSPLEEGQPLRFPRHDILDHEGNEAGGALIPAFLKNATAEFALHLLSEDRTAETNRDMIGFRRVKIDTIELEADRSPVSKPVIPPSVWSIIRIYGRSTKGQMRLARA